MAEPLRIAVLVSGEGTTLEGLARAIDERRLPARIVLVAADRAVAPAIERARRRGLTTLVLPTRGVPPDAWAGRLTAELEARRVALVVLAGFLSILPASWVERWSGRALNLHPSLLPRFGGSGLYGLKVHRAVLEAGETETGASVHLVTEDVDRGPVVAQARLAIRNGDTPETLRTRLHPVEVELLAETVGRFADGTLPLPYPPAGVNASRGAGGRRT